MLGQYPATTPTASMAAVVLKIYLFILLLHTTISKSATDRRFSDLKRCADEDCSMLLCRGKAAQDFNGPDCRFLSFKKGETIYVYYKLSGKRSDAFAGSVGSRFGYFPKDLLIINHVYTDKELEVPAEETDFVCFDTGLDKFDSYELDTLLGSSVLSTEGGDSEEEKLEDEEEQEKGNSAEKESKPLDNNGAIEDSGRDPEAEEVGEVREQGTSQLHSGDQGLNTDTKGLESDTHTEESIKDDLIGSRLADASVKKSLDPESTADVPSTETLDEPPLKDVDGKNTGHVSEGKKSPSLKTKLGSTFDAVISDDETTRRITPYYDDEVEEEEGKEPEDQPNKQEHVDSPKPALISFSKDKTLSKPELVSEPAPSEEPDPQPEMGKKSPSLKTKLGSTFDAVISDDENTRRVTPYYDDEVGEEEGKDPEDLLNKDEHVDSLKPALISFSKDKTLSKPELVSEPAPSEEPDPQPEMGKKSPSLKTKLGSTFDAVISDDENTRRVTPYYDNEVGEEEGKDPEDLLNKDEHVDSPKPALISFSKDKTLSKPELVSEPAPSEEPDPQPEMGKKSPSLKTKLGSTFDAVISDDENTRRVTPYYDNEVGEEEGKDPEDLLNKDEHVDSPKPALISFSTDKTLSKPQLVSEPALSEEPEPQPEPVPEPAPSEEPEPELELVSEPTPLGEGDSPPESAPEEQKKETEAKENGGMWSSLGDKVFAIVSGGERTDHMTSSEEDEDEEEEEKDEEEDVKKEMESETAKAKNQDSVELSGSDPHRETEDMARSPKESIFDDHVQAIVEESASDVPDNNSGKSLVEEGILSESASEAEEEDNLTSSQPDSSAFSSDKESISLDDGKPDPRMVPKDSPGELPTAEEPLEPQHDNVKLEISGQLDESPQERDTEQNPEDSIGAISPKEKQSRKSAFQNPSASGDESVVTESSLDAEMAKRIRRAKEEVEHLLVGTLMKEKPDPHPDKEQEEETLEYDLREGEEEEELLEDENAVLSSSSTKDSDTKEEVTNSEAEGEELDPEEPETVTEFEKSEEPEATDDTHETEETARDPSDEEDHEVTEELQEMGTETDVEFADPDESHLPPFEPFEEHKDKKTDGGDEEYSDDVRRLTLLRSHFPDEDMKQFRRYLGLKQLIQVEALFSDLDQELRAARQSQSDSSEDVEMALEAILESSENSILDKIETMLDERAVKRTHEHQPDAAMFDEEAVILDNFQEFAFHLRQKYSTTSDSEPLASENQVHTDEEEGHPEVAEDPLENPTTENLTEENLTAENHTAENLTAENHTAENLPAENHTAENLPAENRADAGEHVDDPLESTLDSALHTPDIGFKEDGGRFNKNKENQGIYKDTEETPKGPQAILENSLDIGFGFQVESPSSGSQDSASISDYHEDEPEGPPSSPVFSEIVGFLLVVQERCGVYAEMVRLLL